VLALWGGDRIDRHQHPPNNDVLGAPPGVPIDECNAVLITPIQYSDGTPSVANYWRPTPAKLQLLNQGRSVRLTVLGRNHPPLMRGVDGDGML
jgi:hypothetical protein